MQGPARYAAAMAILDDIAAGRAVEAALLNWARRNRYAGSKDRAAIRDIVFSIQRRARSCAVMGQGRTGRHLLRGYLAQEGVAERGVFGVGTYGPAALSPADPDLLAWADLRSEDRSDLQPWVWERLRTDYGADAPALAAALRHRAPVWLRVNTKKAAPDSAFEALEAAGFGPRRSAICETAIEITRQHRALNGHEIFRNGWVELQDLSPQRALRFVPAAPGMRLLDYCAGGGGKALALAAQGADVDAHDAIPARMVDVPKRADRAGVSIRRVQAPRPAAYDIVVADVPCSGSGAWRRVVEGKWTLSKNDLSTFVARQRRIAEDALTHLRPGGSFIYMTCSLFAEENQQQSAFLGAHLALVDQVQFTPLDPGHGDGFYVAVFKKP